MPIASKRLVCDLLDVADRELDKALPRLVSAAILC